MYDLFTSPLTDAVRNRLVSAMSYPERYGYSSSPVYVISDTDYKALMDKERRSKIKELEAKKERLSNALKNVESELAELSELEEAPP